MVDDLDFFPIPNDTGQAIERNILFRSCIVKLPIRIAFNQDHGCRLGFLQLIDFLGQEGNFLAQGINIGF
jgi:hypothetical protein